MRFGNYLPSKQRTRSCASSCYEVDDLDDILFFCLQSPARSACKTTHDFDTAVSHWLLLFHCRIPASHVKSHYKVVLCRCCGILCQ